MRRQNRKLWPWIVGSGIAVLSLVGFNLSSGCPCRSSLLHFEDVPFYGWMLIVINLAAFMAFLGLRHRNRVKKNLLECPSCQASLRADWIYCPSCASRTGND